jgi:site-specific DNA-methyltransferase (adenine-specific)
MKVHFSSNSNEWATPKSLFDTLDEEFLFTLDPCATKDNAKCSKFYTQEDDGLSQNWSNERVFMNPPYGREIGKWMKKASESYGKGKAKSIVCLVPSRTDTKWWHDYAMKGEITFIKGRLKFGNVTNSAPFPSAIVVFGKHWRFI